MVPGIDPKVDYAFKWLFGRERNRALLIALLQAVLQLPPHARIVEVQLLNPFSDKDAFDDKLSIVDLKVRDQHGRQYHVEMQLLPERAFRARALYYWAELHRQQLQEGAPYADLRPTVSICFTDFALFPNVPDYVLKFQLLNRERGLPFSDDLALYTLELPKFRLTAEQLTSPLDTWLYFLRYAEVLDTAALPVALQAPEIQQAMEELIVLSQTDLERERYLARVKVARDELSRLHSAREEGRQEGRQEGLEKGEVIGIVHTCQKLLHQPLTPREELLQQPLEELQQLARRLEQELTKPAVE
jgi:predicted transposase/invertase (TIGR01784 family)